MKLTNKQIKQIIKEELGKVMNEMMGMEPPMDSFSGIQAELSPDHPDYDYVAGIIMRTFQNMMHLAPLVKQGLGNNFKNDIYDHVAEEAPEHANYITERVMQMLMEM